MVLGRATPQITATEAVQLALEVIDGLYDADLQAIIIPSDMTLMRVFSRPLRTSYRPTDAVLEALMSDE